MHMTSEEHFVCPTLFPFHIILLILLPTVHISTMLKHLLAGIRFRGHHTVKVSGTSQVMIWFEISREIYPIGEFRISRGRMGYGFIFYKVGKNLIGSWEKRKIHQDDGYTYTLFWYMSSSNFATCTPYDLLHVHPIQIGFFLLLVRAEASHSFHIFHSFIRSSRQAPYVSRHRVVSYSPTVSHH